MTELTGHRIELPDDRSVFVGVSEGFCYIEFMNKGNPTRIKLSAEAANALKKLIPENITPPLHVYLTEDCVWKWKTVIDEG